MYSIVTHPRVDAFIEKLDRLRKARIDRIYDLFEEYGTSLPDKYLKKLGFKLWELRPGDIRLFITLKGTRGYVVHGIYKKSKKTPKKDIRLALRRIKEYLYEK